MTVTEGCVADVRARMRSVRRPEPILDRGREAALTERQRELLDQLSDLFRCGFAHLTMADIASELNCSLRTLYGLAESREELVLIVVDRNLRIVGRSAGGAVVGSNPLDAIRAYLSGATVAVDHTTEAFIRDLDSVPGGRELSEAHSNYLVAVTAELLDYAVERADIVPVDTAAVARVIAGLGRDFTQADVISTLAKSPKDSADEIVDIVLRGLLRATEPIEHQPGSTITCT